MEQTTPVEWPLVLNSPHLTPARDQTCSFYQEQNVFQLFLPGLLKHVILIRSITYSESYSSQVVNLLLKAVNPNGPPPRAKGSVPCIPQQMWHFKILVGLFACSSQLVHLMWLIWGGGGWDLKDSGIETTKGINVNSLTELDI